MIAVKGNVEYTISEAEKDKYKNNGFDILDDKGKKIAEGEHKKVSFEAYKKIQKELEKLKAVKAVKDTNVKDMDEYKNALVKIEGLENEVKAKDSEIAELKRAIGEKDAEIVKLTEKLKK